jgi:hypothetical protein
LSEHKIPFAFPCFDFSSFAPYVDDEFKSSDNKGWTGSNNAFNNRINTQYYKFKSEIVQEIRVNDFLQKIPNAFVGMCKEYANKVIENFKETRDVYTNAHSTGSLDVEKKQLQNDFGMIDKMLSFIKDNLLTQ